MAVSLMIAAGADAARWYEDYEAAIAYMEAEGCSPKAIERLGAAVVDKSKPRLNARTYAQRQIDYLPYYQLTRAHLACGNLQLARQYLERSASEGVAPVADVADLRKRIEEQQRQQIEPEQPTLDTGELASRAAEITRRLETIESEISSIEPRLDAPLLNGTDGARSSLQSRLAAAVAAAATARQRLEQGLEASDPFAVADASAAAAEASRLLETLSGDLDEALEQARIAQRQEQERLARLAQQEAAPTATAATSAGAQVVQAATRTPIRPRPTPGATPAPIPADQQQQLPDVLRRAADSLFRADYEETVSILERTSLVERRHLAAAALMRAAARFSQWRSQGGTDTGLLEAIESDIEQCRSLAPDLVPDPRLFTPPFCALFQGAGIGAGAGSRSPDANDGASPRNAAPG